MHIVELGKLYPPHVGGVERHMQQLVERLLRDPATRVDVLCGQDRSAALRTDLGERRSVRRLATLARVMSTPITLGLRRAIAALAPDVIHFHSPYPWADVAGAESFARYPLVVTHHMDIVRHGWLLPLVGRCYARTLHAARRVIATSPQMASRSPWLAPLRAKVEVIPISIDVAHWDALLALPIVLPPEVPADTLPRPLYLYVGRLAYYKGLPGLLRALVGLAGTLVVAGSGPLLQPLRQLARTLGVRVQFVEHADDRTVSALYRLADVFVLPSDSRAEAFGMVLLEASLHGLPLVSCRVGTGVEFANLDGRTGLQVGPGDVAALHAALRRLGGDTARRADYGAAGAARVRGEFDLAALAERTRQVLQSAA
jgi:glycosyltransferase involved in cell wall biosynthesis